MVEMIPSSSCMATGENPTLQLFSSPHKKGIAIALLAVRIQSLRIWGLGVGCEQQPPGGLVEPRAARSTVKAPRPKWVRVKGVWGDKVSMAAGPGGSERERKELGKKEG